MLRSRYRQGKRSTTAMVSQVGLHEGFRDTLALLHNFRVMPVGPQVGRMKRIERQAELKRRYFFDCCCPACEGYLLLSFSSVTLPYYICT